jgi:pilus assembly protein CpaE
MRTYILSDAEALASQVRHALNRRGYECPSEAVIPLADYPRLAEVQTDFVVLCLPPDPERALTALTALAEVRPVVKFRVVAVGPGTDPKLILRTMRAGADEFVTEDDFATDLDEALARLRTGAAGAAAGKTFAVLGASGGGGASTVAVNVAVTLAKDHGGGILIDLKLETGDLAALLDLDPPHTIADLCGGYSTPDGEMLAQSLVAHASGVRLLASPRRQASAIRTIASMSGPGVTADTVREVLNLARSASPHTVVEVSPTFREEQAHALGIADAILLVFRLDFPSLRNTRRALEHLDALGIDRGRIRLVGNRHGQPHSLKPPDVEGALGMKLFHLIPDDTGAMNVAANVGEPVVLGHPKAPSARSLKQLAAALIGPPK